MTHFWKTVPQNMKYKSYHMVQEFYYCIYTRKKWKPMSTLELIHRSVHNSIIHNNKKVETIYVPINCWMDKQNVVDSHNGTEFSNKKERSTNICYNIDEFLKHAKWKKTEAETIYFMILFKLIGQDRRIHRDRKEISSLKLRGTGMWAGDG